MILKSLFLQGFRSFREPTHHDFTATPAAVIVGRNGHGKSSFFVDAIEWVLLGTSRSRTVTGVISIGDERAVGELVFAVDGVEHKIRRTRTRSSGSVDFYVADDTAIDGWSTMKTDRTRDTQAQIAEVLGVAPDALFSSAMLKQGEAGVFTRAKPTDRRRVLREIMALGAWEEAARAAGQRLTHAERAAAELHDALAQLGDTGQRVIDSKAAVDEAAATLAQLEEQLAELRTAAAAAGERATTAAEHRAAVEARADGYAAAQRAVDSAADARRRAWDVLDRKRAAAARAAENEARAAAGPEHEQRVAQLVAILDALGVAEQRRAELESTRRGLYEQVVELRGRAAANRRVTAERERALHALDLTTDADVDAELARVEQQLGAMPGQISSATEALADARRAGERVRAAQQQLAVRRSEHTRATQAAGLLDRVPCTAGAWVAADSIQIDDHDPPCDLAGDCPLLADARQQRDRAAELAGEIAELEAVAGERPPDVEALLGRVSALNAQQVQLEQRARALRSLPAPPPAGEAEQLADEEATTTARGVAVKAELDALPTASSLASEAGIPGAELADARWLHDVLATERRAVQSAAHAADLAARDRQDAADADAAAADLEAADERLEAAKRTAAELAEAAAQLDDARAAERAAAAAVAPARAAVARATDVEIPAARRRAADAERAAADAEQAAVQAAGLRERHDDALRDVTKWRSTREVARLAPVLLLEAVAIPLLEAEANRVLSTISSTGMQVRLDTQRAKSRGDGMIETLDIAVRDEAGERPYEDFSGGEQFRIDIAFALAQSVLLGGRRRAPVDWLIVDEGWGSLDGDGVASLKDVFTGLQRRYSLLLVITHVPAVAECLPQQITVVKTPTGSRLLVS